jgi:uncharacterized membrane protein
MPDSDDTGSGGMQGDRLIAFSDGVTAIIVTIMVLDLHAPTTSRLTELLHLLPTMCSYALSFLLVSIYWVNHHHLFFANRRVDRSVLWLNIHFLFWLSLFPLGTAYVSATRGAPIAVAAYAALGVATALAFRFLGTAASRRNNDVPIVTEVGPSRRRKSTLALFANILAVPAAFVATPLAFSLLALPAALYFLPDARVEQQS